MKLLRTALVVISLLYPLAVYVGLQHFDARSLVLLLVAVAGLRVLSDANAAHHQWLWVPLFGVLVFWILISNSDTGLKLYPVLLSLSFLIMFAWSLRHPPSMVERMARLREPNLPPAAIPYTATVTKVWCLFFILNGGLSLATALWASTELWLLYNGLIAYLLMGLLFGGERLVRQHFVRAVND